MQATLQIGTGVTVKGRRGTVMKAPYQDYEVCWSMIVRFKEGGSDAVVPLTRRINGSFYWADR
jgi:hypothetical protein